MLPASLPSSPTPEQLPHHALHDDDEHRDPRALLHPGH